MLSATYKPYMLSVVILNVIMLIVVAPKIYLMIEKLECLTFLSVLVKT